MSYKSFTVRIKELWWLYQLARASPPMLVTSSLGVAMQLSGHQAWAKTYLQKALSKPPVGLDEFPVAFLGAPPDTALPDELKGAQTFRYMHDLGQEMSRHRLPELIFVNAVFAYECEISDLKGVKPAAGLAECFSRRNKYAHTGGIADREYVDKLALSPLKNTIGHVQIGTYIPTTDEVLLESIKILLNEARSFESR